MSNNFTPSSRRRAISGPRSRARDRDRKGRSANRDRNLGRSETVDLGDTLSKFYLTSGFSPDDILTEYFKSAPLSKVEHLRDELQSRKMLTSKALKDYVTQHYHKFIDTSNQIITIERDISQLGQMLGDYKTSLRVLNDTSILPEKGGGGGGGGKNPASFSSFLSPESALTRQPGPSSRQSSEQVRFLNFILFSFFALLRRVLSSFFCFSSSSLPFPLFLSLSLSLFLSISISLSLSFNLSFFFSPTRSSLLDVHPRYQCCGRGRRLDRCSHL